MSWMRVVYGLQKLMDQNKIKKIHILFPDGRAIFFNPKEDKLQLHILGESIVELTKPELEDILGDKKFSEHYILNLPQIIGIRFEVYEEEKEGK